MQIEVIVVLVPSHTEKKTTFDSRNSASQYSWRCECVMHTCICGREWSAVQINVCCFYESYVHASGLHWPSTFCSQSLGRNSKYALALINSLLWFWNWFVFDHCHSNKYTIIFIMQCFSSAFFDSLREHSQQTAFCGSYKIGH